MTNEDNEYQNPFGRMCRGGLESLSNLNSRVKDKYDQFRENIDWERTKENTLKTVVGGLSGLIMVSSFGTDNQALAQKKERELITPKTFWAKVLKEGEKLRDLENVYLLENSKETTTWKQGKGLLDKYLDLEAKYIDKDFNNKVSPADVGKIMRSETLTGENNEKMYSELNLTDRDPTDMKAMGSNLQKQTVHASGNQTRNLYQKIMSMLPEDGKGEPKDFWQYVKKEGKKTESGDGKVYSMGTKKPTERSYEKGESELKKSTSVIAQIYDNNENGKIDSKDIGMVTFKTQLYQGENVRGNSIRKVIDRNPTNLSDVVYINSLDRGIGLKDEDAKKMFTKFLEELEKN